MSQSLLNIVADFTVQLSSAVAIGDTSATLSSATDDDSVSLPSGLYGLTIDLGQSNKEYIICQLSGTSITSIQSISRQGAATTGFARAHRRGAKVSITDWVILKRILNNLNGTTGFDSGVNLGYDGAPTGLTGNHFATVNYVLSVVNGGTVTFDKQIIDNQTAGENLAANDVVYFKESDQKWYKADADLTTTFDQLQIGIAQSTVLTGATVQIAISGPVSGFTGLTAGSKYYLSNTAGAITTTAGTYSVFIGWALSTTSLLFNPVLKTLPTQKEKDAMTGSSGVPSSTNKFVTQDNIVDTSANQSQTTQNGTVELGEADLTTKKNKIAQSFIPTCSKISSVSLYKIANSGSFTGTVTISLQADNSGNPSGVNLVSITLSNSEYNNIAVGEFMCNFTSEYTVVSGETLHLVITSSTSDNANHPNIGINTAGGYASGILKYNNTTDGWVSLTSDLYFKIFSGVNSKISKSKTITRFFTSNGVWTKPDGIVSMDIEVVGGGGGSAGSTDGSGGGSQGSGSSGGGGGKYAFKKLYSHQIPTSALVTVGAGGTGGAKGIYGGAGSTAGGNGGASSFGSILSANGGNGSAATTGSPGAVGTGATTSSGDGYSKNGTDGSAGYAVPGGSSGGNGGASYLGAGGTGGAFTGSSPAVQGTVGGNYGGGAGGSAGGNTSGMPGQGAAGSAGGNGVVIITEYYS